MRRANFKGEDSFLPLCLALRNYINTFSMKKLQRNILKEKSTNTLFRFLSNSSAHATSFDAH